MAGASTGGAGTTTMACIAAGGAVVTKAGADTVEGTGMTDGAGTVADIIAGNTHSLVRRVFAILGDSAKSQNAFGRNVAGGADPTHQGPSGMMDGH